MSKYSSVKTTSHLKDNSWIRKTDDEDDDIDRDPNYAKYVLTRHKSNGSDGPETDTPASSSSTNRATSVQALTKRFGGTQDAPKSSTLPSSNTSSSNTKSLFTLPPESSTTTTITKDGRSTTETTITTSVRSLKSSKTETFTERVKSSSKGIQSSYSPTRTTVTTNKGVEGKLYDTLLPSVKNDLSPTDSRTISSTETVLVKSSSDPIADLRDDFSPLDSKSVSSTETVTVKSSNYGDGIKTTTTTRTSSTAEDDLYGTLLPKSITSASSPVSIRQREIVTLESSRGGGSPTLGSPSSTRRTSSYSSYADETPSSRTPSYSVSTSSYDYGSATSPSVFTTSYRTSSRSDDSVDNPIYSKSSSTSVYAAPERTVLEKDLCTICRKPFTGEAKMVLDDMRINCHATCFKCDVCNGTLGHMKAGDTMWIYKRMVHCENCFDITREKWHR